MNNSISLETLRIIESIHSNGSFEAAAKELHRVRSALTYKVKQLEDDLGVLIFDRSGHRAVLTPIGQLILQEGKSLLLQARLLEEKVSVEKTGWENLFSIIYNDLIPFEKIALILQKFQTDCPNVNVSLHRASSKRCWEGLIKQEVSLAIGMSSEPPNDIKCERMRLGKMEFSLVASPSHPCAQEDRPSYDTVKARYRLIRFRDGLAISPRMSGILEAPMFVEVNSLEDMILSIRAGLGVGFLPRVWSEPYLSRGELVTINGPGLDCAVNISCAFSEKRGKALEWWRKELRANDLVIGVRNI